jgi:hypothetical protein
MVHSYSPSNSGFEEKEQSFPSQFSISISPTLLWYQPKPPHPNQFQTWASAATRWKSSRLSLYLTRTTNQQEPPFAVSLLEFINSMFMKINAQNLWSQKQGFNKEERKSWILVEEVFIYTINSLARDKGIWWTNHSEPNCFCSFLFLFKLWVWVSIVFETSEYQI